MGENEEGEIERGQREERRERVYVKRKGECKGWRRNTEKVKKKR